MSEIVEILRERSRQANAFDPDRRVYIAAADEIEWLRALVREVAGGKGEYIGRGGASRCLQLCSRLAESGWFKRAEAALSGAPGQRL